MALEPWRLRFLSWTLTAASRSLLLRDRLLQVTQGLRRHDALEEFFIASGNRRLECAYLPSSERSSETSAESKPAVLFCHGIGETVAHWSAVQALFHDHGIGSLVFDYAGYGRSTGPLRAEHFHRDLVSAHAELRRRVGPDAPVFLLGFSLGSGIAAQGAAALHPSLKGLFLCESFDSFREAACAVGFPRWLTRSVPDLWQTAAAMEQVHMPVWVVHSDSDHLFSLAMAERIAKACGPWGELIVVQGFAHNEPYLTAAEAYWRPVMQRIRASSSFG